MLSIRLRLYFAVLRLPLSKPTREGRWKARTGLTESLADDLDCKVSQIGNETLEIPAGHCTILN